MNSPRMFLVAVMLCATVGDSLAKPRLKKRKAQAAPESVAPLASVIAGDWETIRNSYGNLGLIAGVGADQDVNSWIAAFEGADAKTVELSNPHMAAADAAGNIYIADKESNSILKVTPAGTIHTVAGTHVPGFDGDGPATQRQLNQPNGVFVLADGTFYILDLNNNRIRRVSREGAMTTVAAPLSGIIGGRALWVSPKEDLVYFADRFGGSVRLLRWTPVEGVEVVATGFPSMGNIDVDRTGAPVVTGDTANRVYRVAPDGSVTVVAGNGAPTGGGDGQLAVATGLDRVRGVACHPGGGFFLATQKGSHIWYVDPAGIIHKMMDCLPSGGHFNAGDGQPYSTPGFKMSEPRAITIAPNGDLLITASDYGEVRVVKCLAPPSPPARLSLERSIDLNLQLRWSGVPWQSYFIEHSPSLSPADWQTIGVRTSEPGGDTVNVVTTSPVSGGASQGFYRLRAPR